MIKEWADGMGRPRTKIDEGERGAKKIKMKVREVQREGCKGGMEGGKEDGARNGESTEKKM